MRTSPNPGTTIGTTIDAKAVPLALLAAALVFTIAAPAPAQEVGFRRIAPQAINHVYTHVSIAIDATHRVADVEVDELFRNDTPFLLEGEYLFPLPRAAVFAGLSLYLDGEELAGEMLNAERARAVYEEIVRKRRDPALVELIGNGLLRARIFPMEPGAERRVTLRYTHVLERDGEALRLTAPRLAGMAPIDGVPPVRHHRSGIPERDATHSGAEQDERHEGGDLSVRVVIEGASDLGTPYSPTHRLRIRERSGDRLEIAASGSHADASDFDLLLPVRRGLVGTTLLTHAPRGTREPGYFMLLLSPPMAPGDGDVRIARDVTLVLDTSGSMRGGKIDQAKAAIDGLLSDLTETDRFRVITFASVVTPLHEGLVAATPRNVRRARRDLEAVVADGSTNIMGALEEALDPAASPGRLPLILFLTDGLPTVGEQNPVRIADAAADLSDGERVFAVGVGHDVNTYLLDRLADSGRGAVSYVRPEEDVERAVSSIARRIAMPALSDLRITDAPAHLEEIYPDPLPDLFYGDQLVVLGRYRVRAGDRPESADGPSGRRSATGPLLLEGRVAGTPVTASFDVEFPARDRDNGFVARLWASRKAGELASHIRRYGADPESVAELRELGLRYGVLTDYTAYLVLEPGTVPVTADELTARARREAKAPAAQTGRVEFDRASRANALRGVGGIREAEEAMASFIAKAPGNEASDPDASWSGPAQGATRTVDGRIFRHDAGVWTDLRHLDAASRDEPPIVVVAAFSPAYFELLRRIPELASLVAVGDRVMIAGDGLTVKIVDGADDPAALREWESGSLERVVVAFGGETAQDSAPRR